MALDVWITTNQDEMKPVFQPFPPYNGCNIAKYVNERVTKCKIRADIDFKKRNIQLECKTKSAYNFYYPKT